MGGIGALSRRPTTILNLMTQRGCPAEALGAVGFGGGAQGAALRARGATADRGSILEHRQAAWAPLAAASLLPNFGCAQQGPAA